MFFAGAFFVLKVFQAAIQNFLLPFVINFFNLMKEEKKPNVRKVPKRKIKYTRVTNQQRHELIRLLVYGGCNITQAAAASGVNYENAKLIYRIYKAEGRVLKTPTHVKRFVK